MITALLLTLAVGQVPADNVRPRVFRSDGAHRITRLGADDYAFFEAFPSSGAGLTSACSTTAPTGARGETLTFTRASSGTCTKTAAGGLATTGIADGDLVVLSTNVARVEYDSAGVLGLLVEAARTNVLLRNAALTNAAWADVGTPTVSNSETDPFGGTLANTIEDNDGAAYEGRSQAVTVSAGAAYFMHCYVKAGTRAEATISIDGTTQAITGLSATTWSIVEKADASSSGVSIPIQVLVGDAVGDTGTVIFGGCQVEAGAYRTSIIPTEGTAVARAAEGTSVTLAAASPILSMAGTVDTTSVSLTNGRIIEAYAVAANDNDRFSLYVNAKVPNNLVVNGGTGTTLIGTTNLTMPGLGRVAIWLSPGATQGAIANGTENTFASARTAITATTIYLGRYGGAVSHEPDGIITKLCADPSYLRCR